MTPLRRIFQAALFLAIAAGPAHAGLPAEAQAAVDHGVTAARLPDYPLALRYFEEARKLAPDAPEIHFNLGLAESKILGRELRAIAWFGAYLAANPAAPNAAVIKQQIMTLDVTNQSNVLRLLNTLQGATDQVSGQYHVISLKAVASRWADFGDFAAALNTVKLMTPGPRDYDPNVWNELSMQGSSMTIKDAVERHVRNYRDFALRDIAHAQVDTKDLKNARRTIELMSYSQSKTRVLIAIAESESKSGDKTGALKTLRQARDMAGRVGREPGSGLTDSTYNMKQLQEQIAATEAEVRATTFMGPTSPLNTAGQPPSPVQASDWLKRLDDTAENGACPLNTETFLDLPAYLKSAPADNPDAIASRLGQAASVMLKARQDISRLLKAQGIR